MNRLFTNGDSLTAGWNIVEDGNIRNSSLNKDNSWSFLLSKKLLLSEQNLAYGGHGNDYIYESTLNYFMSIPKEDWKHNLVVIGWTTYDRFRMWDNFESKYIYVTGDHPIDDDSSRLNKFYKKFFIDTYNEEIYIKKTLSYIVGLQNFFERHEIPYYFFDALGWVIGLKKRKFILKNGDVKLDGGMESIINRIEPMIDKSKWYLTESYENFADKLNSWGTDIGGDPPRGHPGKVANHEFCNLLYKNINKLYDI